MLAQRLVRVLCPECKVIDDSPKADALKRRLEIPSDCRIYKAMGCRACRQTGFHGRRGVFEMMDMNNEIREMILKDCSSGEIRDAARKHGMRVLSEDGWRLVTEGVTTIDEVLRVTKTEYTD